MNDAFRIEYIDMYKNNSITKIDAFLHISNFIATKIEIDAETILNGLNEREYESSTAIGEGIAIPHAILDDITTSYIFLHLPENKVNWESYDNQFVDIIFCLIVPKKNYNITHLKQISTLSKHLLNTEFQNFLRTEKDKNKLFIEIKKIQEEL